MFEICGWSRVDFLYVESRPYALSVHDGKLPFIFERIWKLAIIVIGYYLV